MKMKLYLNILIFIIYFIVNGNSVALNGPPLTRYDPCGIGVVHFDKISSKIWKGFLNLQLYPKLKDVEIDIRFQDKVEIYAIPREATLMNNGSRNFVLKLQPGNLTREFMFNVGVTNLEKAKNTVPIVTKFALNKVVLCNDTVKAANAVESLYVLKDKEDSYQHICGRRSLQHNELVTVSANSEAGDWPWHVALFVKDPHTHKTKYKCGGTIVSRTAVVTAGHCVSKKDVAYEAKRVIVVAGTRNYSDLTEVGRQNFTVEKIFFYPSFNDSLGTADLAVLKVNKFKYTEFVQPACIWGPTYDKTELVGKQATIVGFGRTENDNLSEVLRSTYTTIQDDATCINSSKVYKTLLYDFTFCAGYGPQYRINPRNGDSGGGLLLPVTQPDHKISWFLRGVLSRCVRTVSLPGCNPKYYVVYTDIGRFFEWLCEISGLHPII